MSKKVMCLVLSLVMILSTVPVIGFAADFKNGDFEASHVTFTAGGSAGISVTNNAAGSKNAVFWLGEYEDGVLTESEFVKYTLSAGETWTPTLSVTKNTGSVLKAYIWEDVMGGKAIAPVATYPSSSTEVYFAEKDGVRWNDFSNDTLSYTIKYDAGVGIPVIELFPKDNSTEIIEPSYIMGENVIRVVAADGTEKAFTITLIPEEPANVYGGEKTLSLGSNTDNKVSVTNNNAGVFGKASWDKTYKFVTQASASARIQPLISSGGVGKNTYISFDVAFTSANDSLLIYTTRLDATGTSQGNISLTFGPNGKISHAGWNLTLPTFNLNQWYNVAFVQLADGTSKGRIYINGVEYQTSAWYNVYGTGIARLQIAGGPSSGFYMDNYTINADGTYDPTLYQMTALTVTNTTDVSLESDGTLLIPDGYTVSQLLSAVNIGANSATVYSDDTYASKLAGSDAAATGSVLVVTNGNGAYRYYPIKCKMELVAVTNTSVVELQNADASVGGDLMIDDADNTMTVSELLACLNTYTYTAKVYTDSTKATEVASGENIPKRNAVLVTTRGTDERVYNLKFKNLPDETGFNLGTTVPDTQGSPAVSANVAGTGGKEAGDKIISLGSSAAYEGIKFGGASNGGAVIEMALKAPESGRIALNSLSYYDPGNKVNAKTEQWFVFMLTKDGFYQCAWNGDKSNKIADAKAGEWYNVAVVYPEVGTSGAATLYINGTSYSTAAWPFTADSGYFEGIRRSVITCDDTAGTVYVDNLRQTTTGTYNPANEGKPVATSSTVTVNETTGTITVSDGMTLGELISALTIDAKYDATVRGYFDSEYALVIENDYILENDNAIVIAGKNGYSFERAFAYYKIVVE